jgi:hypothetical protein
MSTKRLLQATSVFDDFVTKCANGIYDVLIIEPDNLKYYTFYMYQDFTVGQIYYSNKDIIGSATVRRKDFIDLGFSVKIHIIHFIRSMIYAKLADARTLSYFNKIILQS